MEERPKILMLDTTPMKWDGITMVIYNYLSNMGVFDIKVDVAAINVVEPEIQKKFEGIGCGFYKLKSRNRNPIKYIYQLARLVKKEKYNIVHVHCNSCTATLDLFGAKLGGAKIIIPHSHNTSSKHPFIHKLLRPVFNTLYTDSFACGIEAGRWLFHNDKAKIWRNAIDTSKFRFDTNARQKIRQKYNIGDRLAVGCVANFVEAKNHSFLLDCWSEIISKNDRYILFLIGDGRLRQDVESKIRELGLEPSVILTGSVNNIPDYLSAMDLMVLPSLHEGFPLVSLEWQASGVRALISDQVTKYCKLTDSIDFIPLKSANWIETVLGFEPMKNQERSQISESNAKNIAELGYDIQKNALDMKAYYLTRLSESE